MLVDKRILTKSTEQPKINIEVRDDSENTELELYETNALCLSLIHI